MSQVKPNTREEFSIGVKIPFDPKRFLDVLNNERNDQAMLQELLHAAPPQLEVWARLRVYVDEVLETGTTDEGIEDPKQRDLAKAPMSWQAIQRFSRENPTQFAIAGDGISVSFPSGRMISLGKLMQATSTRQPIESPIAVADRYFGLLVLSGWQRKLGKCRTADCGRYFWLRHPNRTFKRGTFCPECTRARSRDSAVLNTSQGREAAERRLYQLAASHFSGRIKRDPNWHKDKRLKADVVNYLTNRISRDETLKAVYLAGERAGITAKWLGWAKNRQGIEKAIKEASNAKG